MSEHYPSESPNQSIHADDLALALRLADAADAVSLGRFRALDLEVSTKPDRSPVTDADRATEQSIRALIHAERPEDGIFGEEYGIEGSSSRQWVIDPIDGTANFLRGNPIWGTLIALAIDGTPVVGVASIPALGRRFWGATGLGSWSSNSVLAPNAAPSKLRVSNVTELADSAISFPRLNGWVEAGYAQQALALNTEVWRTVGGSDLWSFCMVAEGVADAVVEFGLAPYDIAALIPIVEEAGGRFSGIDGLTGINQANVIASNGALHPALLARLAATSHN